MNRHHLFYPRRNYTTALERKFRGLRCNIVLLDERVHTLLHVVSSPPKKPSVRDMQVFIAAHDARSCGCYEGGVKNGESVQGQLRRVQS